MINEIEQIRKEINNLVSRIDLLENKIKNGSEKFEFEELKKLLNTEAWPEAVNGFQIADEHSEKDKDERAEGIINFLFASEDFKEKKFLDFGCGEGHVANYVSQKTFSVGYDVSNEKSRFTWGEKVDNLFLTSNFDDVKSNAPYDLILIYDVLDHAEDPVDILNKAKSVLSENGHIHMRCHPWCSRHGGHLYKQINKAFAHLVFSEEELLEMGLNLDKTIKNKVIYPISYYEGLISSVGLKIVSREIDEQEPERFFSDNFVVSKRIKAALPENNGTKMRELFPSFQLKQCFLDFIIKL